MEQKHLEEPVNMSEGRDQNELVLFEGFLQCFPVTGGIRLK